MNTPMDHPHVGRALPAKGVWGSAEPEWRAVPALRVGAFRLIPVFEGAP